MISCSLFIRISRKETFINRQYLKIFLTIFFCVNVLAAGLIPGGAKVRGTFTFERGEKNLFNLLYRRMLETHISTKFVSTDSFFSVAPVQNYDRVRQIITRAGSETVELEVHPENPEETEFLLSDEFGELVGAVRLGRFGDL